MDKFKKGEIVINSSGTFAKIHKVVNGVAFCTPWYNDFRDAKNSEKGGVQFNDYSMKACGIRSMKSPETTAIIPGAEKVESKPKKDVAKKVENAPTPDVEDETEVETENINNVDSDGFLKESAE